MHVVLGGVFLAAGVLKVAGPHAFAVAIARLRLVPGWMVGPAAIVLPWIEVVSAVALLVGDYRRPALKLQLALLAAFTILLGLALVRGTAASCGCFGSGDGFWSRTDVALVRNAALLALVAWLLCRRRPAPTAPASPASPA